MSEKVFWLLAAVGVGAFWYTAQQSPGVESFPFVGPLQDDPGKAFDVNPVFSNANVSPGVLDLARAIAFAEGYGVPGSIPARSNNPGDLVMPNWTGATLGSERISVFPDAEQGWSALYHQLQLIESDRSHVYSPYLTFAQMSEHWTSTQRPEWARNVVGWLVRNGYEWLTVDSQLSEVLYV